MRTLEDYEERFTKETAPILMGMTKMLEEGSGTIFLDHLGPADPEFVELGITHIMETEEINEILRRIMKTDFCVATNIPDDRVLGELNYDNLALKAIEAILIHEPVKIRSEKNGRYSRKMIVEYGGEILIDSTDSVESVWMDEAAAREVEIYISKHFEDLIFKIGGGIEPLSIKVYGTTRDNK